jgi:hypothetical protein
MVRQKIWRQWMIKGGNRWYHNKVRSLRSWISSYKGYVNRYKGNAQKVAYYTKYIERWTIELEWILTTWKSSSIQRYFIRRPVRRVIRRRRPVRRVYKSAVRKAIRVKNNIKAKIIKIRK